jgi:hypothetical protein
MDRCKDVIGGEFFSILPSYIPTQVEDVGKAVVGYIPTLRKVWDYFTSIVELRKTVKDQSADILVNLIVLAEDWVDKSGASSQAFHIRPSFGWYDDCSKGEGEVSQEGANQGYAGECDYDLPADVSNQFAISSK